MSAEAQILSQYVGFCCVVVPAADFPACEQSCLLCYQCVKLCVSSAAARMGRVSPCLDHFCFSVSTQVLKCVLMID